MAARVSPHAIAVLVLLHDTAHSFSLEHRNLRCRGPPSYLAFASRAIAIPRPIPTLTRGRCAAGGSASDDARYDGDDEIGGGGCRVLLMDHLNINHERGRHDALNAFYFDFLGCGVDTRKYDNYLAGRKTIWANAGMHQFHLPEGNPSAQVFDGMITLVHDDLDLLMERYNEYLDGDHRFAPLKDTEFLVGVVKSDPSDDDDDYDDDDDDGYMMLVTDPWGTEFCILPSDDPTEDRAAHIGIQPCVVNDDGRGPTTTHALAMEDVTVYVTHDANLDGIGRFYEYVLGTRTIPELSTMSSICIAMGERQTLTFARHPDGPDVEVVHHDFGDDDDDDKSSASTPHFGYPPNYGPHVSVYVTNMPWAYAKAEELGVLYINSRFKRRAYNLEDAIDQCMFRLIDIIDPLDDEGKVILRLEHEVRSATTRDGKMYKSCPLVANVAI